MPAELEIQISAELPRERVLADSSLWIDYYRPGGRPDARVALQEALAEDLVATMAMILIEVLRGAPTRESFQDLEADLGALHWLDVTPAVALRAAGIGFDLERAGTRVPSTDLMIAATAIEHGCVVWHDDGHFEVIAAHSALAQRRFGGSSTAGSVSRAGR
jgi:predicted nucleic acid-binding protein